MLDDAAMSTPSSPFLAAALERGFVHQCTDLEALDKRLCTGRVVAYDGFDCTADSLHVGNLLGIMLLRLFQKYGHKPIVLMGGGTTTPKLPATWPGFAPSLPSSSISATGQATP